MNISQEEQEASKRLWKSYKKWRNGGAGYPRAEGNVLPIEPAGDIRGNLSQRVHSFIKRVVERPIRNSDISNKFLYAQVCIWDPFREEGDTRWATSKVYLNKDNDKKVGVSLNKYEYRANESNKSIFKIQYRRGKRKEIRIRIPKEESGQDSELLTDSSSLLKEEAQGSLEKDLKDIAKWHNVFKSKENERFFYYIPSTFNPDGSGIGGLMLLAQKEFSRWFTVQIREVLESFLSKVGISYQNKIVLDRSRKSAIAGIMARNMSHNLGSHVIWHLSRDVKQDSQKSKLGKGELSKFGMYMQKRMDFIAQVATSKPSWGVPMEWEKLTSTVKSTDLLWDNIARSEDIRREQIEINFSGDKNPLVEVPHGRVGAQAFYTILENLVRNASKHSDQDFLESVKDEEVDRSLEFNINIEPEGDSPKEAGYVKVLIKDNSPSSDGIADKIRKKLSKEMINKKGRINEKAWGLKEIKVCSGYLRGVSPHEIDKKYEYLEESSENPGLLNVVAITDSQEGGLQFEIYLKKPQTALFLGFNNVNESDYIGHGVEFDQHIDELKERLNNGAISHKFLVISADTVEKYKSFLKESAQVLPIRVIICNCEEGASLQIAQTEDFDNLYSRCSFCDTFEVPAPENVRQYLWSKWVSEQRWNESPVLVRWSAHDATIAERGVSETFSLDEVSSEFKQAHNDVSDLFPEGELAGAVFDHKDSADDTALYERSHFHTTFKAGSKTQELLTNGHLPIIKEFSLMSVGIIDERIWMKRNIEARYGTKKYTKDESKKLINVWKKRRVDLMDSDLALEKFSVFVDRIESMYDFMVVHQGIIEHAKTRVDNFESVWKELKGKCRWIVVDTGRGKPDRARDEGLRWVEYSNLSECVVESSGDKKKLIDLLTSLRAET